MDRFFKKTYTRQQLITAGVVASLSTLSLIFLKRYFNGAACKISQDMTGKVVIITGANTGIGKETARGLANLNATVVLACRDPGRTLPVVDELQKDTKNDKIEFIQLDLSDLASVKNFAETFKAKYTRLDILINNAAISMPTRTVTKDGFETHFQTNYLGHFYLTTLLLDVIKSSAPSRIINVSSDCHFVSKINWDDLMYTKDYSQFTSYCQSKLASVMFGKELQRRLDLEKANVKVVSLNPGFVRSDINRHTFKGPLTLMKIFFTLMTPLSYFFGRNTNQGAQTSLYCALEIYENLVAGGYYDECKPKPMSPLAMDVESGVKLWSISESLIAEKTNI